ncbi:hypothetical protein J5N97_007776 [Dioscorea zingiberensis]|uniref:Uncharacterized protein n=1 Tax=Dioscorea zingiberensis TaxID=325984 RepID=A0A9D5DD37_9LILI|nr:hypothetical protein J5N97_007776 [Dioscorea zingiberensis]
MEHAITRSQDQSQTITRKLLIFVGMIVYTVLILQIMALPTKHALSPLFPAFTVPELETSSQTHNIDMTRIRSDDDVSMMEGESDHGFIVEQLEGNVEKQGNMGRQIVAEMRETQQSEKQAETSIEDEGCLPTNDSDMNLKFPS